MEHNNAHTTDHDAVDLPKLKCLLIVERLRVVSGRALLAEEVVFAAHGVFTVMKKLLWPPSSSQGFFCLTDLEVSVHNSNMNSSCSYWEILNKLNKIKL